MDLSPWALRKINLNEWEAAKKAFNKSTAKILFKNRGALRQWMKNKGWRRSWFFLEEKFAQELFKSDQNFKLALSEKVIEIFVPKDSFRITKKSLEEIDHYYEMLSWSRVVEELREIRRAVEAGVIIEVEDIKLSSFSEFYEWAHGRYHALEDGETKWIGDDN